MTPVDRHKPRSPLDLFVSFNQLALQGFGGVLAVAQRELVERKRWISNEEFVEEWSVAQVMPGPNIVNFALMIGGRHFGLGGAVAAVTGLLAAPLVLVLLLALVYAQYINNPHVVGALRGMGAVAAGLIISAALKLSSSIKSNPLGPPACVALGVTCFIGIALLRWPLVYVLPGLGVTSCMLAYRQLKP